MQPNASSLFDHVLNVDEIISDLDCYQKNTIGIDRRVQLVLKPRNENSISKILKIANENKIAIYPISTGKNWGYGSALPVQDDCVILDLSLLNQIRDYCPKKGTITVGPGVTQQQLYEYLQNEGNFHITPVTGAGPHVSILGNLLERGYGITPIQDHMKSLISLKAFLADGTEYTSLFNKLAGENLDQEFHWGIGPFLDGIFSQSNFGIVTRVTIELTRRPKAILPFFLFIKSDEAFSRTADCLQDILEKYGHSMGGVNLMNNRRMLSMQTPYLKGSKFSEGVMPEEEVAKLSKEYHIFDWTGVGCLYGDPKVVRVLKSLIKKDLKKVGAQTVFLHDWMGTLLDRFVNWIPFKKIRSELSNLVGIMKQIKAIYSGVPSEVALPLCYIKGTEMKTKPLNPAHDGCGVIWYSPLVSMNGENVIKYKNFVNEVCCKYGIEPLITLTSFNHRIFDSTVPILFHREIVDGVDEIKIAHECYDELLTRGRELGFFPYRMGIDHMHYVADALGENSLIERVKRSLDPNNILSPGRYSACDKFDKVKKAA